MVRGFAVAPALLTTYAESAPTLTNPFEGFHSDESLAAPSGEPGWYAVSVKPRHDKAVARALENKGYEALAPTYRKRRVYGSRVREADLPLFPGYVFCRVDVARRLPVLTTHGVIQFVGAGRLPLPVDDAEIASLRQAILSGIPLQPYPFLRAGRRVRIEEGGLAGVEGVVVSMKQGPRVVLSITLLQRSVLLEIDCGRVSVEDDFRPSAVRQVA
jgi:transcription antitermination factor NusG